MLPYFGNLQFLGQRPTGPSGGMYGAPAQFPTAFAPHPGGMEFQPTGFHPLYQPPMSGPMQGMPPASGTMRYPMLNSMMNSRINLGALGGAQSQMMRTPTGMGY